jgi:hypothetical protein
MLTVPEAVGVFVVVGLLLWTIRGAIHAEIDRRAHEHDKRTRDEAALHVLEDTPGEGGDDDR